MKLFKRCGSFFLFCFFLFFPARKEMASTKSPPLSQIWADICYTLFFFQTKILEYTCRQSIWQFFFFLPFDRKRYFKATNNCTRRLAAVFCLMLTGILKWNGGAIFSFFHQRKKRLHQNVLRWRQYKFIFATLYILQMTIRERSYR